MFFFPFCIIENILKKRMQYSTLQEAYNLDGFDKIKKKKKERPPDFQESNLSKGPSNIEMSKLSASSEKIQDYEEYIKNASKNCAPLQSPIYTIPITGDCKKEFNDAMKVYTEENFNSPKDINMSNMASNNNIMPYYDEDLEQYFDINNLNDEVKYNPNNKLANYMPNNNSVSYTNNNTNEYTSTVLKNGNNLLNSSDFNLSPEERKKASDALQYLKALELKIDGDEKNAFFNQMKFSNTMGSGGYNEPQKTDNRTSILEKEIEELKKREVILSKSIEENKKAQNNINLIINVFIILFIGGIIILLCDYLVELSIQIGMKKTTHMLEPYINNKMYSMNLPQPHQQMSPFNYNHMQSHIPQHMAQQNI